MKNLTIFILAIAIFSNVYSQTLSNAGFMAYARENHQSVLLSNGKVLVFGGYNTSAYKSAEIYNPTSNSWTATNNMNKFRVFHTSAILPNNKVIAIGGTDETSTVLSSCEIYNVSTGTWTYTGSMTQPRYDFVAIKLNDGRILVAGGLPYNNTCEIFDPTTNTWSNTGNLNFTRGEGLSLTILGNGNVLAIGGKNSRTNSEIYNVTTGIWTNVPSSLTYERYYHSSVLLNNGNVLILGSGNSNMNKKTELYNFSGNSFSVVGDLQESRFSCPAIKLNNGNILVYGPGEFSSSNTKCIEVFDVSAQTWSTPMVYLLMGVYEYTLNKLLNGKILIVGGAYGNATQICKLITDNTTTEVDMLSNNFNINIFPIPTNSNITIEGENIQEIELINTQGQIIIQSLVSEEKIEIDLENYPKGLYLMKIRTDKGILVKKIMLE